MTLENFNENLKKYARLIAETGVNVQDNHSNCSMERRNHST